MTKQDYQLQFIRGCYYGYSAANKLKTFLDLGRQSGIEWLSARGISEKHSCDANKYFKRRAVISHFTDDQFNSYGHNLLVDMVHQGNMFTTTLHIQAKGMLPTWHPENSIGNHSPANVPTIPTAAPPAIPQPEQAPNMPAEPVKPFQPIPTQQQPERQPEKIQAAFSLNLNVADLVNAGIADYINNSGVLDRVNQQIMAEAAKLRPNAITVNNAEPVIIKGKLHHCFAECLDMLLTSKQVYLQGPAGTGKTTLAGQIAESLNLKFGHISVTAGMSEAHLLGRMTAHGEYLVSQFVDMFENGGIYLLDEVDKADSNTIVVLNSALANGVLSVPNRVSNNVAKRHDQFYVICAGNTWGLGSNEFTGSNILDASFLDRFPMSKLHVGYDTNLENEISVSFPQLAKTVQAMRANVIKYKIQRQVSTRVIVEGIKHLTKGKTMKYVIDTFHAGWNESDIKRSLENVTI